MNSLGYAAETPSSIVIDELEDFTGRGKARRSLLGPYIRIKKRYPPLTKQEDFDRLFRVYKESPNEDERREARDCIVYGNVGLVLAQALRFHYPIELQDMLHVGLMALADKVLPKFDPTKARFSTYATHWIRRAIIRLFQNTRRDLPFRAPVHIQEHISSIKAAQRRFFVEHGRWPTNTELAEVLAEWSAAQRDESDTDDAEEPLASTPSEEAIERALQRACVLRVPLSLDAPIQTNESDAGTLYDLLSEGGRVKNGVPSQEAPIPDLVADGLIENVITLIRDLREQTQDILLSYHGVGCSPETLERIGNRHGVTRERIRQIKAKGLKILTFRLQNIRDTFFSEEQIIACIASIPEDLDWVQTLMSERRDLAEPIMVTDAMLEEAYEFLKEHRRPLGSIPAPIRVIELRCGHSQRDAGVVFQAILERGWVEGSEEEVVLKREPEPGQSQPPTLPADWAKPLPKAAWGPPRTKRKPRVDVPPREQKPWRHAWLGSLEAVKRILEEGAVRVMGALHVRGAIPLLLRRGGIQKARAVFLLEHMANAGEVVSLDGWSMIRLGYPQEVPLRDEAWTTAEAEDLVVFPDEVAVEVIDNAPESEWVTEQEADDTSAPLLPEALSEPDSEEARANDIPEEAEGSLAQDALTDPSGIDPVEPGAMVSEHNACPPPLAEELAASKPEQQSPESQERQHSPRRRKSNRRVRKTKGWTTGTTVRRNRKLKLPFVPAAVDEWRNDGAVWVSARAVKRRLDDGFDTRMPSHGIQAWLTAKGNHLRFVRVRDEGGRARKLYELKRLHQLLEVDFLMSLCLF